MLPAAAPPQRAASPSRRVVSRLVVVAPEVDEVGDAGGSVERRRQEQEQRLELEDEFVADGSRSELRTVSL